MNKEKYIEYAKNTFQGKALELVLNNIELFYEKKEIKKNKYHVGEEVKLKKGTYMHGIPGLLDNFDWIVENGFISNDFTEENIHATDDNARYTNCTVTLVVDYENAVVKFTVASEDTGEPTSLQQTEVEPVATKIIENGQVLIIKDGVRYNMMGVKVD